MSTAPAASLTSARVGRGSSRIDSSTCVATITGTPRALAVRRTSFCTRGTRANGTSRPRSPRATITASATSRISSRRAIASGRSSLATSGTSGTPCETTMARAARRSAADCTKLSATRSTPSASPNARSSRVLQGERTRGQRHARRVDALVLAEHAAVDARACGWRRRRCLQPPARAGRRRAAADRRRARRAPARRRWSRRGRRRRRSRRWRSTSGIAVAQGQRPSADQPAGADLRARSGPA